MPKTGIKELDVPSGDDLLSDAVRVILGQIGEDPTREGLLLTPKRVADAYRFLTKGYQEDPKKILNGALFTEDHEEMVQIRDITIYSLCEHHLLPFFGHCQVAYVPKRHLVGISKIVRLVEIYARRLQVQERLTTQIAHTIYEVLDPLGVAVIIQAEHLCMQMRGVEKMGSSVVTSSMLGAFQSQQDLREEFLGQIRI